MISMFFSVIKPVLTTAAVNNSFVKLIALETCLPSITAIQVRGIGRTTRKRRTTHPPRHYVPKNNNQLFDFVTPENKHLLKDVAADLYPPKTSSILKDAPWERGTWTPGSRRTGLICRKIGIYPMWRKNGKRLLTTLLQVVDNHVIKYHPPEVVEKNSPKLAKKRPGMGLLIVGAESTDPERFTGQYNGLFKEAGVMPKKKLTRFFITPNAALPPGTPLYATHFRPGDYVNCLGKTVDHGFQGVVKRWGFKGGNWGRTKTHRRPGNIGAGAGWPDNVFKGTKMPGHMGSEVRMLSGLKIWRINTKYNVIWVQGPAIPGGVNSFVNIYDTMIEKKSHTADNPPHFPTAFPEDWEEVPEELYDEQLHRFTDPSITFEDKDDKPKPK